MSYPGKCQLAKKTGISKRSVDVLIIGLAKKGFLRVVLLAGKYLQGGSTNRYEIVLDSLHPPAGFAPPCSQTPCYSCTPLQKMAVTPCRASAPEPSLEPSYTANEPIIPTQEEFSAYGYQAGISQEDCGALYDEWKAADWCFTDGRRMEKWRARLLALKNRNQLPSHTRKPIQKRNRNESCL